MDYRRSCSYVGNHQQSSERGVNENSSLCFGIFGVGPGRLRQPSVSLQPAAAPKQVLSIHDVERRGNLRDRWKGLCFYAGGRLSQKKIKNGLHPYTVLLHNSDGMKVPAYLCYVVLMRESGAIGYYTEKGKPKSLKITFHGGHGPGAPPFEQDLRREIDRTETNLNNRGPVKDFVEGRNNNPPGEKGQWFFAFRESSGPNRLLRPKVLFLDEVTSHLDSARERAINEVIRRLDITRIAFFN